MVDIDDPISNLFSASMMNEVVESFPVNPVCLHVSLPIYNINIMMFQFCDGSHQIFHVDEENSPVKSLRFVVITTRFIP